MSVQTRSWQELCEAVTRERDSQRLMQLITQLINALDGRKRSPERRTEPEEAPSTFEHSVVSAFSGPMPAGEGSTTIKPNPHFPVSQTP